MSITTKGSGLILPAAVIITADSVRDGVDEDIKQVLANQYGLKPVFEKKCWISKDQVAKLYSRLIHRVFYPAIVHNMTLGPSLLVIYKGKDIYEVLKEAKGIFKLKNGMIQKTGLRLKYQGLSKEELVKLGYRGKQLFYRLFEYRIHSSDSLEDTISICKLILDFKEYALFEETYLKKINKS